jgi:hypothetical protein
MKLRPTVLLLSSAAVSASLLSGADLASYRNFRLGMSIVEVAKQAEIAGPEAKLISGRPERIEELDWRIKWTPPSVARSYPFEELLFSFYNGELFEINLAYDPDQTRGLTDADMIEAISGVYGSGTKPVAVEMAFNSGYSRTVKVIARWEDVQSVLNLVRLPYDAGFGIVMSSSSVKAMAERAILESERLDRVEAPQRELALRAKQLANTQASDEKARVLNKPGFRP